MTLPEKRRPRRRRSGAAREADGVRPYPRRRPAQPDSLPRMPTQPRFAPLAACLAALLLLGLASQAEAQDRGSLNPKPLPPLADPDAPSTPAKELFGRAATPASGAPHPYGSYAKGCFSGGEALPVDGATWQVMRLSRNRMWGTPHLVDFIERLATKAPKVGWPGLLVGDMSQPRGGPMLTGPASHQLGLAADA